MGNNFLGHSVYLYIYIIKNFSFYVDFGNFSTNGKMEKVKFTKIDVINYQKLPN